MTRKGEVFSHHIYPTLTYRLKSMEKSMKVLVISHNVFSSTTSMGKTLLNYFRDWHVENIAQFYIHSEVPTDHICERYFRITDKEILKSVFVRKSGVVLGEDDIQEGLVSPRTDRGMTAKIYQKARMRTPAIYLARNIVWNIGKWNTKRLQHWVDEFAPDIVFLASGDYSFIYRIALKIARRKDIPLVVSCMDDYYLHNRNEKDFLGKLVHRLFMRQVKRTMSYASCLFCICEKMSRDYSSLFGKPCYTIHTPTTISSPLEGIRENRISYIGNLGYRRNEQLLAIGRALQSISEEGIPTFVDVYSSEKRPEILAQLSPENGINFCGEISASQVKEVMAKSTLLIHTESFDEKCKKATAYSVSTKIADSLASGTCIFAYGPSDVASMEYLIENRAAYCVFDIKQLGEGLTEAITNVELRDEIVTNACNLAEKNHQQKQIGALLVSAMEHAISKGTIR